MTGINQPDADIGKPYSFRADNAYPNPFNQSVRISFYMEQPGQMQVAVFNVKGERVKSLFDQYAAAQPCHLTWDGTNESGQVVTSGNYLIRFIDEKSNVINKKIVFLK